MTNAGRPRPGPGVRPPSAEATPGAAHEATPGARHGATHATTHATTHPAGPGRATRHGSALPGTASQGRTSHRTGAQHTPAGDPARRRVGRTTRWRRSARRALRGPRRKWIVAGTIGVLVVVLGLLVNGFLSSPAKPLGDPPSDDARAGELQSLAPTPSASASGTRSSSNPTGPTNASDIKKALQRKFDNPLNNLRGAGAHTVTITARSSRPMPIVGYLVPTGSDAYGARKKTASFTLTQRAYGTGYLAAVFIQADSTGARITCSVTVDGKLTNTASTSGAYGRQICLG